MTPEVQALIQAVEDLLLSICMNQPVLQDEFNLIMGLRIAAEG